MINLKVDECYAFDYLSILEIKWIKGVCDAKAFRECSKQIIKELGYSKYNSVFHSNCYNNLYLANKAVFNSIDKLNNGVPITAKEIDDLNKLRYKYKKMLQEEFFPTNIITEKKR